MMTRRPIILGAAASGLLAFPACAQEPGDRAGFAGEWNGVLRVGAQNLRLRLVVGEERTAIYSLDQGGGEIPAEGVRIDGDRIRMRFPMIRGSYQGQLRDGALVGEFTQGAALPLTFVRGEPAAAQPPEALTAAMLERLRQDSGAIALAAAAESRAGRTLALADGLRAYRRPESVTTTDVWHLGSITKSMTATLVARCIEAGLASWDNSVGGVLGATITDMRAEYRDVTFRHLLSHRAGLQANIPIADFVRYRRENPDPREERVAFARQALRQTPIGPKEQSFEYSNNGFVITGAMLEAKLGAPWETLIRRLLFTPLGMTSAGFGAPGAIGAYDHPVGHAAGMLGVRAHPPGDDITDNPAALGPAGRVHAAFADVLKYLAAHRDRTDLLRPETWAMLHAPPFGGDYAMGWVKRGDTLWHNGSNTLWYAELMFDPTRGVSAVAAANDGRPQAAPAVGSALVSAAQAVV